MQFKKFLVIAGMLLSAATGARAGYNPVGVQNDVAYADVINGGWTEVYRGKYTESFSISSVFNLIAAGSNVMLAGIANGSQTFDVLASAKREEITQWTAVNQTHTANGAEWYFNERSMGFAGLGDRIDQDWADIAGSGLWQYANAPIERDRLSWHHEWRANSPNDIIGGWRSGSNLFLQCEDLFERVILVQTPTVSAVPEIDTYAMMLIGVGMMGTIARRRRTKQV